MVEAPAILACLWIGVCATNWQGGGICPRARDILVRKVIARYIPWVAGTVCCVIPAAAVIAQPSSDPVVSLGAGVSLQQILSRGPPQALGRGWQLDPRLAARFSIDWGLSKNPKVDLVAPARGTAPTVPAVGAVRAYPVFFDWDRTDLSARARQIVAEAAAASSQFPLTRIEINGYTDPSGSAQYNKRLSAQRGESVHAELLRDGVPPDAIEVTASGTKNPLVQTEIARLGGQTSRVEIVLR